MEDSALPASLQRSMHRVEDDGAPGDDDGVGQVISKSMEERTMGKEEEREVGDGDSELEADQVLGGGFGGGGLRNEMTVARLMDGELTAHNGQEKWERTGREFFFPYRRGRVTLRSRSWCSFFFFFV
jgi:hypothetical protein